MTNTDKTDPTQDLSLLDSAIPVENRGPNLPGNAHQAAIGSPKSLSDLISSASVRRGFPEGPLLDECADSVSGQKHVVIENLDLTVGNVPLSLKGTKYRKLPLVFRNCAISITGTVTVGDNQVVYFENCSFTNFTQFSRDNDATTFSLLDDAKLLLSRCVALSMDVYCNLSVHSTVTLYDCWMYSLNVGGARNVAIYKSLPNYSTRIWSVSKVLLSGVKSTLTQSVTVSDSSPAVVEVKDCVLAGTRLSILNSVTSARFSSSAIELLYVCRSVISALYMDSYTVNILKAVDSFCNSNLFTKNDSVAASFPTNSYGFPETPITIYKKASAVELPWIDCDQTLLPKHKVIVTLVVPAHAKKHISLESRKIRVSEAKVVDISDIDSITKPKLPFLKSLLGKASVRSEHDPSFKYKVGKVVTPTKPFVDDDQTCSVGIHGFLNRKEAERY